MMSESSTVSLETISLDTTSIAGPHPKGFGAANAPSPSELQGHIGSSAAAATTSSASEQFRQQRDASARKVVLGVARSAASQGAASAKTGFIEVRQYVQNNPNGVRAISFCIALALLVFSLLGMLNIFDAVFKPYQYLFAFYNIIFAGVIIVADGKAEWFNRCWDAQARLFHAAAFLATQTGRATFYFYLGSINLFMLPDNWLWKLIYVGLGGVLCLNGALMLLDSFGCCCKRQHSRMPEDPEQGLQGVAPVEERV